MYRQPIGVFVHDVMFRLVKNPVVHLLKVCFLCRVVCLLFEVIQVCSCSLAVECRDKYEKNEAQLNQCLLQPVHDLA